MILTQKILKKLITEALSKMEADCLAQLAPAHYVSGEFRGRTGIDTLAKVLMDRAEHTDKSWGDYVQQHKEMEEMYPGLTEMTSDALENCLARKKQEAGGVDWQARRLAGDFRAPRPAGSPRVRPGGAGGAADETFAVDVSESKIRKIILEKLTKSDKAEIKKMVSSELKKILQDELAKEIGSKKTKEEIGEITKKVIKKLYKDLSFHHPYIIDRIKV